MHPTLYSKLGFASKKMVNIGKFYFNADSVVSSIEVKDNRGILAMRRMQDNPGEEIALNLRNSFGLSNNFVSNFQFQVDLIMPG